MDTDVLGCLQYRIDSDLLNNPNGNCVSRFRKGLPGRDDAFKFIAEIGVPLSRTVSRHRHRDGFVGHGSIKIENSLTKSSQINKRLHRRARLPLRLSYTVIVVVGVITAFVHLTATCLGQDGGITVSKNNQGTLNQLLALGMSFPIELESVLQRHIRNVLDTVVNGRINLDVAFEELINSELGTKAGTDSFKFL